MKTQLKLYLIIISISFIFIGCEHGTDIYINNSSSDILKVRIYKLYAIDSIYIDSIYKLANIHQIRNISNGYSDYVIKPNEKKNILSTGIDFIRENDQGFWSEFAKIEIEFKNGRIIAEKKGILKLFKKEKKDWTGNELYTLEIK